jgi:hypothetical protein
MSFDPFGGNDPAAGEKPPPPPNITQKLKSTLAEASGYASRSVMDSLK